MLKIDRRDTFKRPELSGLKTLYGMYVFLVISLIVMPQYFGVHIAYDLTCMRFATIFIIAYMILNRKVLTHCWKIAISCEVFYPLLVYLFVAAYTMVFRANFNSFFVVFLEILPFFLLIYGIRYVIGYQKALRCCLGCAYFLACYGLVEFVYGRSLYLQFLKTLPTNVANCYRSGHYRIMGPCGHSLAYGLLLLLFIAICCYDYKKNQVYLFRRPILLILLLINVMLTGSRSTLGIAGLEVLLILFAGGRYNLKRNLVHIVFLLGFLSIFLLFFHDTSMGRYILGQITSVIDEFCGTDFASNFGISKETLQNSTNYRKVLPKIFLLDWLNPWVGRGSLGFGGAEIDGVFVHSIDHFYVAQYIRYAYPGLVSFVAFILTFGYVLVRDMIKYKYCFARVIFIGTFVYFFNLWWVDSLQTMKFLYLFAAIYYGYRLEKENHRENVRLRTYMNDGENKK